MSLLEKHEIETLYMSPMMQRVLSAIADIAKKDALEMSKNLQLNISCEQIALRMAEFRGKQRMSETFTNPEMLLDFLQEYVVQETQPETDNEETQNNVRSTRYTS